MRAARCALLNFPQTERAGRSRLFFLLFLLSNLVAKVLRFVHCLYKQEYDKGNNKEVDADADCRSATHVRSTRPKHTASWFLRLSTPSMSPSRFLNLATRTLPATINAFLHQSSTGIAGLRKEDRKQKQSKHECRNGFGEGDKIVARLGIEVLPPPASRNMRLGMVYRSAHQVLRELENAVYQQGKNNDGNHGYRFLPLCVNASFY